MKIYFDMDGVLADFDAAAAPLSDGRDDLNNRVDLMTVDARDAKNARWCKIEQNHNFWADIPVMNGIEDLLRVAADMGELFVLTSVPNAKKFVGGEKYVDFIADEKKAWIARHLGTFFPPQNVIIARVPKEELVHPTADTLLIDDRAVNIDDWRAAGGRGLVFGDVATAIKDLTSAGF